MLTFLAFLPLLHCGFIEFDDPPYVTNNAAVQSGLNAQSIAWAWTTMHAGYWQPLSWMSLMLDSTLSGIGPAGYHRTNLILHAISAGVVFLVLRSMTGTFWRSVLVAALYAVHPLRVESVAWVAERKDVLSNLLAWLTIGAYVLYARSPNPKRYLGVLVLFVLGLLAKPMIVTLPALLLLLDYWPLRRWKPAEGGGEFAPRPLKTLILEKVPLMLVALAAGASALIAQGRYHALIPLEQQSLVERLATVLIGYGLYLWKMVWFPDLTIFYPLPATWEWARLVAAFSAASFLAAITLLSVYQYRQRPWLIVGWLWFVGVLAPVSGIFQSGQQALADRFSYLPCVGLLVMIVWSIPMPKGDLTTIGRWLRGGIAVAVILALGVSTWVTSTYWKSTDTVFARALAVSDDNWVAHDQMSLQYFTEHDMAGAMRDCREALAIYPDDPVANMNMGIALDREGKLDAAIRYYRKVAQLRPDMYVTHYNLGNALQRQGKLADAYEQYRLTLLINPDYQAAHCNIGAILAQTGMLKQGIKELRVAVALDPANKAAQADLATALAIAAKESKSAPPHLNGQSVTADVGQ